MIKNCSKFIAALAATAFAAGSLHAANVTVERYISTNTTWTADNTYLLQGYTFVRDGATLTIEAGTVVKSPVGTGANAAALIITRGSKIMAEGTAEKPIIFTSTLDELNGNLTAADTGLWGGLILMGKAQVNSRADKEIVAAPVEDQIEGLSVTGDEIALATFGGTDDHDNSGVLRYVSVRHGGANVGADNEINGVSFGGVGDGTTVEYVEVFANKDDGFEFFGGTVNCNHLVTAFSNDDGFDFDQGYRGKLQYLFNIQHDIGADHSDKGLEWDGATAPLDADPKGEVYISNLTAIGVGPTGAATTAVNIRDNVNAHLYNSVFVNFAKGLLIESDVGDVAPDILNNVWFSHVAANNTAAGLTDAGSMDYTAAYWSTAANNNVIADAKMIGISYTPLSNGLDPRSSDTTSPIWTTPVKDVTDLGGEATDYVGAFGKKLWIAGWTKIAELGLLPIDTSDLVMDGDLDPADDPARTTDVVRGSASKPVNIATRGFVGIGAQSLTAGFVISGTQAQSVLIRAVGPTLGSFGVPGTISKVQLRLFKSGDSENAIATSRVVRTQSIALSVELGAFALGETAGDATMVAVLAPGAYTAEVTGVDGQTGIALVEVYEID